MAIEGRDVRNAAQSISAGWVFDFMAQGDFYVCISDKRESA